MTLQVEIDKGSGFCFGVTTAIQKAEEELSSGKKLYCLGDIVHNGMECERLRRMGLVTLDHEEMTHLHNATMLLRAHGEPPETYEKAAQNHIEIVDATCPVVLQLQRRIRRQFEANPEAQIVIFGKNGHAEVMGLIGQTNNRAIVIEHVDELDKLDFSRDIYLYSQTTKSLDEFHSIIRYIRDHISGRKSSNGKVLFNECRSVNPRSYQIEGPEEISPAWFTDAHSVGICGATSTPKWLMEECRDMIMKQIENNNIVKNRLV